MIRLASVILLINGWNNRWANRTDARQTGIFFPKIDLNKSIEITKQSKTNIGTLVRALTGHDFRKRHTNITDEIGDETCRFCKNEAESPAHIITECPSLLHHRARTFNSYTADVCQIWTAKTLVEFLSAPSIAEMENGND